MSFKIISIRGKPAQWRNKISQLSGLQPYGVIFDMKYHLIYASDYEKKVLEIDTDDVPPNIGDSVQLPFGENKQLCQYRATDVFYTPISPEKTIYYIEVKPA